MRKMTTKVLQEVHISQMQLPEFNAITQPLKSKYFDGEHVFSIEHHKDPSDDKPYIYMAQYIRKLANSEEILTVRWEQATASSVFWADDLERGLTWLYHTIMAEGIILEQFEDDSQGLIWDEIEAGHCLT